MLRPLSSFVAMLISPKETMKNRYIWFVEILLWIDQKLQHSTFVPYGIIIQGVCIWIGGLPEKEWWGVLYGEAEGVLGGFSLRRMRLTTEGEGSLW